MKFKSWSTLPSGRQDYRLKWEVQIFDPKKPISKVGLSHPFKMACDNCGIHEKATMWLFPYFMRKHATTLLIDCLSLKAKLLHFGVKEGVQTACCQVVNYLLETYATDDNIAKSDSDIDSFLKLQNMLAMEFANALWLKTPRCPRAYDKYVLKRIFVQGLLKSITHSIWSFWSS